MLKLRIFEIQPDFQYSYDKKRVLYLAVRVVEAVVEIRAGER